MDAIETAAREAQRAYNRQYYAEHKDKRKEYNRRHWERKAAQAARETASNERRKEA